MELYVYMESKVTTIYNSIHIYFLFFIFILILLVRLCYRFVTKKIIKFPHNIFYRKRKRDEKFCESYVMYLKK